jgi:hypothetical protein
MATTLGGVTLKDPAAGPEGHQVEYVRQGVLLEMADGTLVYQATGNQLRRFKLFWHGLDADQLATIEARAAVTTHQKFQPPDDIYEYWVVVAPGSFRKASRKVAAGLIYEAWLTLEEQYGIMSV